MKKVIKNIKYLSILSVLLLSFSIWSTSINANDQGPVTFSIQAKIPDNQIDKNLTYFDLRMQPEMKQTIQIEITNNSDVNIVSNIKINAASTSTNGVIAYSIHGIKDKSMHISIEDIAKVKTPQVTIEANASKLVDIELTMPKEAYNGVLLGGIYVSGDVEEKSEEVKENGFEIENKIAYALGLKLTQSDQEVKANMNLVSIQPSLVAMRTAMDIQLQNSEAIIMKNVMIDAQIYKKGSNTILHSAKTTTAEVAPNSSFAFVVDWENQKIEPGKYRLKMRVEYKEDVWEWDEEFEIKEDQASIINEEAIHIEDSFPIWMIVAIGIIIVAFVFFFAFILGKRSNKEKE